MRVLICFLILLSIAAASPDTVNRAHALYQRTEYQNSLKILAQDPAPDAATHLLIGKNHFMMGDFRKATESFEKVVALTPNSSEAHLWLARGWGRRAENSTLLAISYAGKAHQSFEKAVALDPHNMDATSDLFDYYLNAPGFLGGGVDKAQALARSIAAERPVDYEYEEAQLAEKRNDPAAAETHFRRAMELAPSDGGRIADVAHFLAKRGRFEESDRLFEQARKIAPDKPAIIFTQASTLVETKRNLEHARVLLKTYLQSSLTPDDPSRQEAEKLLKRAGG